MSNSNSSSIIDGGNTYRREYSIIEDGHVYGRVRTDMVGSDCTFHICSVEEA